MATISELVTEGRRALAGTSETADLDAELLLAHVIDGSRSTVRAHPHRAVSAPLARRYRSLLARRRCGEPLAYLTGVQEFWSLPLAVNAAVLVPRPETELLVERSLARLPRGSCARVLDLGTGSGAIALAIARERASCQVTATDLSPAALDIARLNAARLGLGQIQFVSGDWFAPLENRRFEVILANPPYVDADDEHLPSGGTRAEPRLALIASDGGHDALRTIIAGAPGHLAANGWLALEHAPWQAAAVHAMMHGAGFVRVSCSRDLAGRPRVTEGTLESQCRL